MAEWDRIEDVVVVGTGVAGLSAALTASARGLDPLLVERGAGIGGSSALAGGGMWVPANRFVRAEGVADSAAEALRYLDAVVGDGGRAASPARREAFVTSVNDAIAFMEEQGLRFRRTPGYPDYHPDLPGASVAGRGIESVIFDMNRLGRWAERLPARKFPRNMPMGTLDVSRVTVARRTLPGALRYGRITAHHVLSRARGQRLVGGGGALVSQLLHAVLGRGVAIWTQAPAVELVVDGDRVTGVVVERDGKRLRIAARRAVFLGAGGFARNDELRREHHPQPARAAWTSAAANDLGDGLRLGLAAGAATELLDEVWGGPSSVLPGGPAIFHVSERSKPGSIVVDARGERYFNEAKSYVDAVHDMYEHERSAGGAIPSWLVFDATYRRRYPFGALLPGITPRRLVEQGYLKRARTLEELAARAGIDPAGLTRTVERFNRLARSGVDEDFHRGENAYDTYYGDPRVRPNPTLAPLTRSPFYAVELYPGDLGTKGGLVTDVDGRVLREDGSPVEGLYAAGNTTASVMGRRYPGPGVTLAPALTFAYRAMCDVAAG